MTVGMRGYSRNRKKVLENELHAKKVLEKE